jgi:NAD(P)-dependent dehydrogenase (short-subunit alcohol dehydrogenase family)
VSARRAERVDISDPTWIAALFVRIGMVDGIICTGGAARFKPWAELTDEDWTFSLANKLLGQVNVVRYGLKSVLPGGAITPTSGLASQYPAPGSANITTVNSAVGVFVRAVAAEPSISIRVNAVSPGWVAETLQSRAVIRRVGFSPLKWPRSPSGSFATARPAPWSGRQRSEMALPTRCASTEGGFAARLEEAHVVRWSIEAIVATVDIPKRRGGEFFRIKIVEQRNLDSVDNAAHCFNLAAPRRADPACLAK